MKDVRKLTARQARRMAIKKPTERDVVVNLVNKRNAELPVFNSRSLKA